VLFNFQHYLKTARARESFLVGTRQVGHVDDRFSQVSQHRAHAMWRHSAINGSLSFNDDKHIEQVRFAGALELIVRAMSHGVRLMKVSDSTVARMEAREAGFFFVGNDGFVSCDLAADWTVVANGCRAMDAD
jgi:hypothetical protein